MALSHPPTPAPLPVSQRVGGLVHILTVCMEGTASGGAPLGRRLYLAIREAILIGRLRPGERLPATRSLSETLGIARNTVAAAYDQLLAEGYVTARVGSGTFVSADLPDLHHTPETAGSLDQPVPQEAQPSRLAADLLGSAPFEWHGRAPFARGVGATESFPWDVWSRLLARGWRQPKAEMIGQDHIGGLPILRAAVADLLRATRALSCRDEQVFIVGGAQQALDLALRLLVDPGDAVMLEDPGFRGGDAAVRGVGGRVVPQPVDADGLIVPPSLDGIKAVLVTPSRNFPLGTTLSLPRRLALLEAVHQAGAWLIEDDYDADFRYDGRPVASLHGLDHSGQVLYAGTFGRTMFPGLRLGYLVVPERLVAAATAVRWAMDGGEGTPVQQALAAFIAEGHYVSHLRSLRVLYGERWAALKAALQYYLAGVVEIVPADGGLHLTVLFRDGRDDQAVVAALAEVGVLARPLSPFYREEVAPGTPSRSGLVLVFASWPVEAIEQAVARMAALLT